MDNNNEISEPIYYDDSFSESNGILKIEVPDKALIAELDDFNGYQISHIYNGKYIVHAHTYRVDNQKYVQLSLWIHTTGEYQSIQTFVFSNRAKADEALNEIFEAMAYG